MMENLRVLVYINNSLGIDSIRKIVPLLASLRELCLSNIKPALGRIALYELTENIVEHGRHLKKLRLSNLNLNDARIVDKLVYMISLR